MHTFIRGLGGAMYLDIEVSQVVLVRNSADPRNPTDREGEVSKEMHVSDLCLLIGR